MWTRTLDSHQEGSKYRYLLLEVLVTASRKRDRRAHCPRENVLSVPLRTSQAHTHNGYMCTFWKKFLIEDSG